MLRMTEKTDLIYKLEGRSIEEGISARQLAPILMALGEMIEKANAVLNPDGPEVAVHIKPFKKGSFEIDVFLFYKNNMKGLLTYLSTPEGQQIETLLKLLGLAGGGGGLIGLMKWLQGKPTKAETIKPNQVRIEKENNDSVTIDARVYNLYQNANIQKAVSVALVYPLEKPEIEEISTFIKNEKEEQANKITKAEASAIKQSIGIPDETVKHADDEIINPPVEMYVHPKKVDLEGDNKGAWTFRVAPDGDTFTAIIKDDDFLKNVSFFNHRDLMKIRVVEKQKISGGKITHSKEVIEVVEYKKASSQPDLFKDI